MSEPQIQYKGFMSQVCGGVAQREIPSIHLCLHKHVHSTHAEASLQSCTYINKHACIYHPEGNTFFQRMSDRNVADSWRLSSLHKEHLNIDRSVSESPRYRKHERRYMGTVGHINNLSMQGAEAQVLGHPGKPGVSEDSLTLGPGEKNKQESWRRDHWSVLEGCQGQQMHTHAHTSSFI